MHELAIVEAILDEVQNEVRQSGAAGRIARIELAIGRLSGVCVDSVRFAFELLTQGTPLEGAELRIREPRAVCVCQACGARTEIGEMIAGCPNCSDRAVTVEGGRDLVLETIEIEDPP
ncbi:MAG: hydrogenase maturation nickel metallochaperone HypA [Thermoguttaceae bacterium]|jgi:hydrogenase nickel incorporation protein HypA/HybF|nr:hydrogenase maturation nickel metallochaperone HypA [Thermoguttaceae bacterium]